MDKYPKTRSNPLETARRELYSEKRSQRDTSSKMSAACESRNQTGAARSSAPPSPESGAVVITIPSLETEHSALPGGAKVHAAAVPKALVDKQRPGRPAAAGDSVAVDLGTSGGCGGLDGETVCRICYLSPGRGDAAAEMIDLGCRCKDELGTVHRHCAEAWFRIKGNRCCEICGTNAKNITSLENGCTTAQSQERRISSGSSNTASSERVSWWKGQKFCNFLMACLVISFILPWFFRINMF